MKIKNQFIALVALCVLVSTQHGFSQEKRKSGKGDFTADVGVGGSSLDFRFGSTKFRYFLKDNFALRFSVNGSYNSSSTDIFEKPDGSGDKGLVENTNSNINIAPGIEYHFKGNEKLSPFIGGAIGYSNNGSKSKGTNTIQGTNMFVRDASYESKNANQSGGNTIFSNGSQGASILGFIGSDYYWGEGFYFGMEVGYQALITNPKQGKVTRTIGGVTTDLVSAKSSSMSLNMQYSGNLKLGFRF